MAGNNQQQDGFSLIEVIVAVGIFTVIAFSAITTILHSLSVNRLSGEEDKANFFAQEGIEAVRSIKNRSWGNVITGTYGLDTTGNTWNFTASPDVSDKFTRTIAVTDVGRDVSGNIVDTGGTPDSDTKKVTSTVTWDFSEARTGNNISLVTYLTNFRKAITSVGDGLLIYGQALNNMPRVNIYDNSGNTFGTGEDTVTGAPGRNFVIKTSPTKRELVAGYVDSSTLRVICFDGTNWSSEWSDTVGGNGSTRRFDIAYEYQSGNVMVLYSTDSGSGELHYRTKSGSLGCGSANWVDRATFDSPGTDGVVTWVKLAADARSGSNLLGAAWADMNRNLQAAIWNGTTWTQRTSALETILECRATCTSPSIPNGDSFDIDFESVSGHLMIVWGSGGGVTTNGAWYNKCDGGALPSCSWNESRSAITGMANDATTLDISSNPNSDEVIFASVGDGGSDLQAALWSGSAWTGTNDLDISALTPVAGASFVATGWLINGSTSRGVIVYVNGGTQPRQRIFGFVWNGSSFVRAPGSSDSTPWFTPSPLFGLPRWYDIQTDPKNKDKLMFLVSNSVNDLFAKRLEMDSSGNFSWTNPGYADGTSLEDNLVQSTTSPYYFGYWRNP